MSNIADVMNPRSMLYAMIHSQPGVIAAVLERCARSAQEAAGILARSSRVFLAGTGTNSHAAVVGEYLLRAAGLDAYATTNFEFVTYPRPLHPGDAIIVLSQTGTTRFGAQAVKRAVRAGVPVIGVTGQASPMPDVDVRIEIAPKELSDTYTQSYTAALTILTMMAVRADQKLAHEVNALALALSTLPAAVSAILSREEALWPEAVALSQRRRIILAGAGPNSVTAREGALKLKESCFLTAEGFELETMLHGGLQAVEAGDLAVVVAADGAGLDRTLDAVRALDVIGASILVLADERVIERVPARDRVRVFGFAPAPEPLSPLLATVPLQLLAAFTSFLLGTNPDNFRFDEPRYREAIESLTL